MSPTTTTAALNKSILELRRSAEELAELGIADRLELLERLTRDTLACAADQVRVACWAKGIELGTPAAAEEWLGGPVTVLRNLRLLRESLKSLVRNGHTGLTPANVGTRPDGQTVVQVFPRTLADRLLLSGFRGEIWMEPGVAPQEVADLTARIYRSGEKAPGGVALVLGAGNVASIGPMDVLYKMFVENQVCVLKLNPVNDYLGRFIEKAFAALVERGFLRIAYGGAEVGEHLVHHDDVDEVHITGSDRVHDAIVWGPPGEQQELNRRAGTPVLRKRITSELGCVTPIVVAPGAWSEAELGLQAENVASMVVNNGSFNCNAAKVVVTSAAWPQREAFLDRLTDVLGSLPLRRAYYPGSVDRYDRFLGTYGDAKQLGERTEEHLPWAIVRGLDPAKDELAFGTEAWCGFLAETALPADGPDFFAEAARFCNERVWGTLSCGLIAQPRSLADPAMRASFEAAIGELRYGGIGINHWPALAYGLVSTTWGAFPGHTIEDVQSGIDVVHNTFMLERTQKSVVHGPFAPRPKPPWFATHKSAHKVAERMARYEASGSLLAIPGLAIHAFRA